ncbi:MAG: hypothetical protein ABI972_23140 [Acidobacteriota bacterium]
MPSAFEPFRLPVYACLGEPVGYPAGGYPAGGYPARLGVKPGFGPLGSTLVSVSAGFTNCEGYVGGGSEKD